MSAAPAIAAKPPARREGHALPVAVVCLVILLVWYLAAIPMNAVVTSAKIEAAGGGTDNVYASVNYTLQEYANDVIYTIAEACREAELPMPHIISESGRALTAHHALLLHQAVHRTSVQPIQHPGAWDGCGDF